MYLNNLIISNSDKLHKQLKSLLKHLLYNEKHNACITIMSLFASSWTVSGLKNPPSILIICIEINVNSLPKRVIFTCHSLLVSVGLTILNLITPLVTSS